MVDIDKFVGRAALLVPVLHLVTCGIFMAGYSTGFGGNIGGMFGPSDFFTITIQHLITTYVLSLGMPVLVTLLRHRSGYAYATDMIDQENDEVRKARLVETRHSVLKISGWGIGIISFLSILTLFLQIWTGAGRDYFLVFNLAIIALLPTWWKMANRLNFHGLQVEMSWCALAFTVAVFGLGLDRGDRDRRLPYALVIDGSMRCGDQAILSPIGDRFISVTPDNRRHVINDECKIQFSFQATPVIPSKSLAELVGEKMAR